MNVIFDPNTDTLRVVLTSARVAEGDEDKSGVILDDDAEGNLVALDILDASRRIRRPASVHLQVTTPAA